MTSFARLSHPLAGTRSSALWGLTLALTAGLLLMVASPAQAVVTEVGTVPVGLQPRTNEAYLKELVPAKYANPEGNPVLHGTGTYAIYWDPTDHYHGDWQNVIDSYFQDAGTSSGALESVFSVDAQYTDKSNKPATYQQTFKGAYTDTAAYPTPGGCTDPHPLAPSDRIGPEETSVCLTTAQVASQVEAFVNQHGLPKGLGNVFYILTPPGVTVCLDEGGPAGHCSDYANTAESYANSFCSYHAAINPGKLPTGDGNSIVYGVIPWSAGGFADPHLKSVDRTPAWECQDGGLDPSTKPTEQPEKAKERNAKEEKEFGEMDTEEKAKVEERELLEGPHQQEPNQLPCPTSDGGCDTGLADLIINQIANEQQNIVTNPLLNAWKDTAHNENTDECRFLFAPVLGGSSAANPETGAGTLFNQSLGSNSYYLNDAFNLSAYRLPYPGVACVTHTNLDPRFTAPNPVNSGEIVGFDGMESDITLDAAIGYSGGGAPQPNYATYTWNFGDDSAPVTGYAPGAPACENPWLSPCAASVFHAYTYGGVYNVTLTVTDVGGHTASVAHELTVNGPTPPAPAVPGSASPGAGGGPGGGGSAGSSVVPAPVAAAAVISRSLRKVLHKGLVVRYSVNEQVTGHFEVLISRTLARRLKLGGAPAVGLPAGTPPEVMIARAILVTTGAGRSTIVIKLSKHTAARLSHTRSAPVMLRLIVRNSASKNPASTTVVSSAKLSG